MSLFRLVYELLRLFELVAAGAEGFRLSGAHYPGMGLVTVKTLHALLHVEVVLAYFCFIGMALSQTVR